MIKKKKSISSTKWHQIYKTRVYNAITDLINTDDEITFEQVALVSKVPIRYIYSNKEFCLLIMKYINLYNK